MGKEEADDGTCEGKTISSGRGVDGVHNSLFMTAEFANSKNERTHCLE